jgi:hypothetical protein
LTSQGSKQTVQKSNNKNEKIVEEERGQYDNDDDGSGNEDKGRERSMSLNGGRDAYKTRSKGE